MDLEHSYTRTKIYTMPHACIPWVSAGRLPCHALHLERGDTEFAMLECYTYKSSVQKRFEARTMLIKEYGSENDSTS